MSGWPLAVVIVAALVAVVLVAVAAIYAVMPKQEQPTPVAPDRSHWQSPPEIEVPPSKYQTDVEPR